MEEFGRIWRYGSEPEAVTLDRLGSGAWLERRSEVSRQIDETAVRLVAMAAEKEKTQAAPVAPPRQAYAAFVARFPSRNRLTRARRSPPSWTTWRAGAQ